MRNLMLIVALVLVPGAALAQAAGDTDKPCLYVADGVSPALIIGARRQVVSLRSLTPSCNQKLIAEKGSSSTLQIVLRDPSNTKLVLLAELVDGDLVIDGSHLLFTSSVNFLSLFGAQSGGK